MNNANTRTEEGVRNLRFMISDLGFGWAEIINHQLLNPKFASILALLLLALLPAKPAAFDTPAAVPSGKGVYVDASYGSDSSGTRGNASAPFKSIPAAKAAALSGDTIYVYPGLYTSQTNLLKAGVNYWFYPGAILTNSMAGGSADWAFFDDRPLGGPTTNTIGGLGEFDWFDASGAGTTELGAVLCITNPASRIIFHGLRSIVGDDSVNEAGLFAHAFYVKNAAFIFLDMDEVLNLNPTSGSQGTGFYWERADCYVNIRRMVWRGTGYAVWGHDPAAGATNSIYYTGQYLEADNIALYQDATHLSFKSWFNINEITVVPNTATCLSILGGKFYVTAQKINAGGIVISMSSGEAWIQTEKMTGGNWGFISGTGTLHCNALQYEDTALTPPSFRGFYIQNGTNYISGSEATVTNGNVLTMTATAGRTFVQGLKLRSVNTTPGGNTNSPVSLAIGGLSLENCSLVAPSGADSISAASAQAVTVVGSLSANNAINANVAILSAGTNSYTPGAPWFKNVTAFTNLNALGTLSNLANVSIPAHYFTNGAALRLFASGSFTNNGVNTNELTLVYGSQTALDSGLQTASNGVWRMEALIQPLGVTSQRIDARLDWSACQGVPFAVTNVVFFASQTNGIATTLALQGASRRSGGLTNDQFRVYWEP